MNGTYSFHNNLILRTPRLPLLQATDESLITSLLNDTGFLEAIYLASPVLHDECIKWRNGQITSLKDIQKLKRSVLKYYTRMSSRCTPFGLFSGHSVAEWKEGPTTVVINENINRHTRFDMHYLCALAQQLAIIPCIKEKLLYFPNTSLYNVGDEIRYIEYKYANAKRIHQISSVSASDYLENILTTAKSGITIGQMLKQLISDEITRDEALAFVDELIHAQLLVSELEPAITGPEFIHQLITSLQRINASGDELINNILHVLQEANRSLKTLDASAVNEASEYRSIMKQLDQLQVPYEENKLFQVDTVSVTQQSYIDKNIQSQLHDALEVLNKLMPAGASGNLQSFARRFYSRYEDREMPLLEVLDTETGIGYVENGSQDISPLVEGIVLTGKSADEKLSWGKVESFWNDKVRNAIENGDYIIDIKAHELEEFKSNWNDLPPSMSVLFRIIDGRNNTIFLESAGGSSAANLLGRFAHANSHLNNIVQSVTAQEQQVEQEIVYAEIIHLPESRVGNVLLHPAFRQYEIPYMAKSSLDQEHQIDVQDLLVSVKNGRVILRSKRLGKQVMPRLSTAHNYHYNALPVYQFLCDLQLQDKRRGLQLYLGSVKQQYPFLPRITFGNTIFSLASWQFAKKDFRHLDEAKENEQQEAVKAFRKKWKLPQHVVLSDGDNELLIDFENSQLVQLWLEMISKREQFILKEFFYTDNYCISDKQQRSYANQLAAILVKNTSSYEAIKRSDLQKDVKRTFSPGSEWLYYKLYCGVKSADKILLEGIKPLTDDLLHGQLIDKWFFIRYNDPDFHIRLRLHVKDANNSGHVIQQVNAYLSSFEKNGYIWKLQMDTYNREVERYGSNTIELSETIFHHDSHALLQMLDNTWGDEREQVRWLWGLRAIDELLNSFQYKLQDKLALLTRMKNAFAAEFNMDKLLKLQLDNKHRNNKKLIEQILDSDNDLQNALYPLIKILMEKNVRLQHASEEILALQSEGELQLPLDELMISFIHMLLNRLFTSNQRLHEMVSYDFLFRYYQSLMARKRVRV